MKKGILTSLGLAAVLTLGLASVNEYREVKEVNAAAGDTYKLVTNVSELSAGDRIIIVASGSDYALGTTQNSNNRNAVAITKDGDTVTGTDVVQDIVLENGNTTGTFAFNVGTGYLYAASSSSNYLRTETTLSANSSWSISITEAGVATVTAKGDNTRNLLKKNSSSALFSCYGSGQSDISIYELVPSETYAKIANTVDIYYNEGIYTKKTNINISDDALNELQVKHPDLTIADYYHGGANAERTTYYNGTALLMGNIDGTFKGVNGVTTGINSGYGLGENGSMTHFKLNADGNTVTYDYTVAKGQHDNWKDPNESGMEGFYTTLNDFVEIPNYFKDWNDDYTYTVSGADDAYLADFLAFVAPCLESTIYNSATSKFITAAGMKLSISEETKNIFDEVQNKYVAHNYLALRIYVSSGDATKVTNQAGILAEARIYKDLFVCDENYIKYFSADLTSGSNGTVTYDVADLSSIEYGTDVTFTATPINADFEVDFIKINGTRCSTTPVNNSNAVTYTHKNVIADFAVEVSFKEKSKVEVQTLTIDFSGSTAADFGISTSAGSTGNFEYSGVTFAYNNVQAYAGYAMLRSSSAYICNTTAIAGTITKVEVTTTNGASTSAEYYLDLFTSATVSVITSGEKLTGKGSLVVEADVSQGYSYFNITQKSKKNGQIAKIVITYIPA